MRRSSASPDETAPSQQLAGGGECFQITRNIFALILTPISRQRIQRAHEITNYRHAEQRGLRQKRHSARRETQRKHRIDQSILMIEDEYKGTIGGYVFQTRDFDVTEIDAQSKLQNRAND